MNGFEDGKFFLRIIHIIQQVINPEIINYQGGEDIDGFFEKDGLRVQVEYDTMLGNMIEVESNYQPDELDKVRKWVKQIWDALQKQNA